ncbi:hypothetical protein BLNAU_5430 [Blattamonas nauphoetae]|uniref:Transposase n=1 Tax=Blattamonas nauphoetae TaxID=2049346 RepID=A0ABQ9Y7B1_9EUKA|nr:hypothetical protein BLNAU_5430 [Blattamonas nauphoetae]
MNSELQHFISFVPREWLSHTHITKSTVPAAIPTKRASASIRTCGSELSRSKTPHKPVLLRAVSNKMKVGFRTADQADVSCQVELHHVADPGELLQRIHCCQGLRLFNQKRRQTFRISPHFDRSSYTSWMAVIFCSFLNTFRISSRSPEHANSFGVKRAAVAPLNIAQQKRHMLEPRCDHNVDVVVEEVVEISGLRIGVERKSGKKTSVFRVLIQSMSF